MSHFAFKPDMNQNLAAHFLGAKNMFNEYSYIFYYTPCVIAFRFVAHTVMLLLYDIYIYIYLTTSNTLLERRRTAPNPSSRCCVDDECYKRNRRGTTHHVIRI